MVKLYRKVAAVVVAPALLGLALLSSTPAPARTGTDVTPSDTASYYKAKCFACHGAKAEKKFDASLPDEQMVEAILKGKKADKPPHMPAYGAKGVSAEQANALLQYMKQLKSAQ